MLQPGSRIEKYEVMEPLGEGGMATVYKVKHIHLGSFHGLKVLRSDLVERKDIRDRFLDEGRIQAQLRHPNIVPVTDIVAAPGVAALVAQFVDGPALDTYIESLARRPSIEDVKALFLPLLEGLGHAHSKGIVHRDIKPANILLARRTSPATNAEGLARIFQPMIVDFGIAKVQGELDGGGDRKKTRVGARMGTLEYMSPEQIRGDGDVDHRVDIFALAASLYEFVTGSVPFGSDSEYDTMRNIVEGRPRPIRHLFPGVDPILEACVIKGLASDRNARFQSCADFAALLVQAGGGGATRVTGTPPPPQPGSSGAWATPPPPQPGPSGAWATPPPPQPGPSGAWASPPPPSPQGRAHHPHPGHPPPAHHYAVQGQDPSMVYPPGGVSAGVAALLSLFCLAGLGQMLLGQVGKGLTILLGSIVLATVTGGMSALVTQVLITVDAYQIGTKLRQGRPVGKWEWF